MIKILILDDEKGMCHQLQEFLTYRGYKVYPAYSGKEALSIIKKEKPQILLLDIMMDGISGLDVLKKAKEDNPDVKAIMITAVDDKATEFKAMELGADAYLTKPFSYDKLEEHIIHKVNEVLKLEEKYDK